VTSGSSSHRYAPPHGSDLVISITDSMMNCGQNNRRALRYSSKNHIGVRRKKLDKVAGQKKTFYRIWFDFDRKPILLTDDINMEFQHESMFRFLLQYVVL